MEKCRLTVIEFLQESSVIVEFSKKLLGRLGGPSIVRFSALFLLLASLRLWGLAVLAFLLLFLFLLWRKTGQRGIWMILICQSFKYICHKEKPCVRLILLVSSFLFLFSQNQAERHTSITCICRKENSFLWFILHHELMV